MMEKTQTKPKVQECGNCEDDVAELYEGLDCVACYDCWMEYWRDNEIGIDTSFNDFLVLVIHQ